MMNFLVLILVIVNEKKITVPKKMSLYFLLLLYIVIQGFFISDRYASMLLLSSAFLSIWIWTNVVNKISWSTIVNIHLLLLFIHLSIAVLQKGLGYDFLFVSKSLGFFDGVKDGQILSHRVPGLTFISGDFYASIGLALAIIFRKNKFALFITVSLICYVNLSKVFLPTILLLLLYDFFYVKSNGAKFSHLFILVVFLNLAGFSYSYILYLKDPTLMSTFSSRAVYVYYLIENLRTSFFTGIGFDNFKGNVDNIYYSSDLLYFSHNPHNVWIKFLSELGVVGFAIFICALFKSAVVDNEYRKDELVITILYAIYFILVQLSFHNFHFMNDLYIYIGMLVGRVSYLKMKDDTSK